MRRTILLFCACAGLAGAGVRAAVYDPGAPGFTLEIPASWSVVKDPFEPLPALAGPADDKLAPLLIVTEMTAGRDLFELGDATVRELARDPSHQLAARDAFLTADKQPGLKYVIKTATPAGPYRQVFYFVAGAGGRRFNVLATVAEARWQKYEPIIDNIIKTYRLKAASPGAPASAPAADVAPAPPAPAPAQPPRQSAARRGGR